MKALGLNFTKINAEKQDKNPGKINIGTEIDISDISEVKTDFLKTKEEVLGAKFTYKINYQPEYAFVKIEGRAIVSVDSKTAKEALKQWKKKQIPTDLRIFLINVVMRKASLKALNLEEELGLPLHMPMPSARKQ